MARAVKCGVGRDGAREHGAHPVLPRRLRRRILNPLSCRVVAARRVEEGVQGGVEGGVQGLGGRRASMEGGGGGGGEC